MIPARLRYLGVLSLAALCTSAAGDAGAQAPAEPPDAVVEPSTEAHAGEDPARTESRSLYEKANEEYEARNYAKALELLERAHALYPAPAFLFNLAQVKRQLGRCADARQNYLEYLARETDPLLQERARVGLDRLVECRDEHAGEADARPDARPADPAAPAQGLAPRAAESDQQRDAVRDPQDAKSGGLPTHAWIGWIITGTLGAAAVTSGAFMLSALSEKDALEDQPTTPKAAEDAEQKVRDLAVTTDVLALSALAMAGVSLYWTLDATPDPRTRHGMYSRRPRTASWSVVVSPAGVGVTAPF